MRDLSKESVKYSFVDGVNFHMRIKRDIEIVPVLVAIGVTDLGHRLVLGLQSGDKESATVAKKHKKEVADDLLKRRLWGFTSSSNKNGKMLSSQLFLVRKDL